jgi:para-nitrobenzyl esterase
MRTTTIAAAVLATALSAAGLTAAATASSAATNPAGDAQLTVRTNDGWLHGTTDSGVREFFDIPYAAPPVSALRFQPPQPVTPWTGVRDATQQGPACIQFQTNGIEGDRAVNEDCLYLDIYTPRHARAGDKLPVLFWIHGGANAKGSGVVYGGQRFADVTDSIFVSINYRLGALGYLDLPGLTGNYGLLDQIQALTWVKQNIAAFGGDTHDITIDGQSSGAGDVCDMLGSPLAKGMFERGILESGPCAGNGAISVAAADALGQEFAAAAGCGDQATAVSCLQNASTSNLVAAQQTVMVNSAVSGTTVLPSPPGQVIASGDWNKVPLIVGNVLDEAKLFDIADADITAAQYTSLIQSRYGSNATAVLAHYPVNGYPAPFYALAAVGTDSGFACESYSFASEAAAQGVPVYEEEFNDPTSPTLLGYQPAGIDMSNAHTAELAYLWNFTLVDRPLTSTELALGEQMDRYWAAFTASGNPNVRRQVAWPPVTASAHPVMVLRPTGNTVSSSLFPAEHQCSFWSTIEG